MQPERKNATAVLSDPFRIPDAAALLLDAMSSGGVLIDTELVVRYRNKSAARFLPDRTSAVDMLEALRPRGPFEGWGAALEAVIREGQGRRWDNLVCSSVGKDRVPSMIACEPIRGDRGDMLGVVLTVEAQLLGADTPVDFQRPLEGDEDPARLLSLGKLTARVAHELNNPLDGILRYTNLALRLVETTQNGERGDMSRSDQDRLAKYLTESRGALLRMVRIVRDLLKYARGLQGGYDNQSVNDVLDEAIRAVGPLADRHGVIIAADYPLQDMPTVAAGRLLQVCTNLMKNAIEAMPDGGRLLINAGMVDGSLVLRFADTGPGLPDDIERIFEPFYTTKDPGQGTGLGLAICRDLIEQLGGTLHARNADPRGAVLTVSLPVPADTKTQSITTTKE